MRIAYYPGCEAKIVSAEANEATKRVMAKLGVELLEIENAGCCGSMELRIEDREALLALSGRILALAEEMGAYKLLTICNTCALNLNTAISVMNLDPAARARLNEILSSFGRSYQGTMEVVTLPWLLLRIVGFSSLRKAAKKSLEKMKVAPFYGCHMIRPMRLYGFEHSMKPSSVDILINEIFDGQTVNYPGKAFCCGFHTLLTEERVSISMVRHLILNAGQAGADCILTPCSQCHTTLDVYQQRALKASGENNFEIPILHLSQLVGLAIGIPREDLGFERHMVNPIKMLENKGF